MAAYDASGSLVTLDDPIMIDYTYVAADDRNNGMTIDIRTQDEYNPLQDVQLSKMVVIQLLMLMVMLMVSFAQMLRLRIMRAKVLA